MVVVFSFMDSHKDVNVKKSRYQLPHIFSNGESVKLSKGKLCSLLIVNAEKRGAKINYTLPHLKKGLVVGILNLFTFMSLWESMKLKTTNKKIQTTKFDLNFIFLTASTLHTKASN